MRDYRQKLKQIRKEIRKNAKTLDFDFLKSEFLDWLSEVNFPDYPACQNWIDCLKIFPAPSDEFILNNTSGTYLRLALKLYTSNNKYVISVIQCLAPGAEDVGIITVFVNWNQTEKKFQEKLERSYANKFEDILKAKHTIWAQNFRQVEFHEALDKCAIAILGNELKGELVPYKDNHIIKISHASIPQFPKPEKD